MIIVKAMVHPWNMSPENQNSAAQAQIDAVYPSHKLSYDAADAAVIRRGRRRFHPATRGVLSRPTFRCDRRAEFVESSVDYPVLYSLPNLGLGLGAGTLEWIARMTVERSSLVSQITTVLDGIPESRSIAMGGKTSLAGMGLVDDVAIAEAGRVAITFCLTNAACVHFGSMQGDIGDAVGAIPGVTGVTVMQTLDKWLTPDRVRG